MGEVHVLRAITRLNIGGPARHVSILNRYLADDFPTTLVAGTPPAVEGELLDPEVPVVRVPLVREVSPLSDLAAYRAIGRVLSQVRPVLVHTHLAKAGLLGRLAAWRSPLARRIRTVHTFHGHVFSGYFSTPVSRSLIELERRLARRTDMLVAISEQIREDLLDLKIGRPDQYRVVPLGLELTNFLSVDGPSGVLRTPIGIGPGTPLVGVIGRLVPIKNHDLLLRAMTHLDDVHLAVVGDGPLRTHLEESVTSLGLNGRVHFFGWMTDVPAVLADVDVLALSSRNEGTPMALIEAAASGRPTVATDVGGVRNVVRDGYTGHLVPSGDVLAMAKRIGELLADPTAARQLGRQGRSEAVERFSADRLVHDMAHLYRELG